MGSRNMMKMRVIIERNSTTCNTDPYGQKDVPEWVLYGTFPCYSWTKNTDLNIKKNLSTNIHEIYIMMSLNTDINKNDRIQKVIDKHNTVEYYGKLSIIAITRKPDHLLLECNFYEGI